MMDNTFFFIFNFIKKFSRKFNEDILRLVCAFDAFVNSISTSGSVAVSGADSRVTNLSNFFYWKHFAFKAIKNFFSCTKK